MDASATQNSVLGTQAKSVNTDFHKNWTKINLVRCTNTPLLNNKITNTFFRHFHMPSGNLCVFVSRQFFFCSPIRRVPRDGGGGVRVSSFRRRGKARHGLDTIIQCFPVDVQDRAHGSDGGGGGDH